MPKQTANVSLTGPTLGGLDLQGPEHGQDGGLDGGRQRGPRQLDQGQARISGHWSLCLAA